MIHFATCAKFECARKPLAWQLHRTFHTSKEIFKKYKYQLLGPIDNMYQSGCWNGGDDEWGQKCICLVNDITHIK
jgi:hypothetical protein